MVDNGSSICLIKMEALNPNIEINSQKKGKLSGITSEIIDTLGIVYLTIRDKKIPFYVIENRFHIPTQGLLGRNFLQLERA